MMDTMSRRHAIGMTVGALWLIGISVAMATLPLVMVKTRIATAALVFAVIVGIVLITVGVRHILAVLRMPGGIRPRTPEERKMSRDIGRQFGWIVAGEVIAIVIVNALCVAAHRPMLIIPFAYMIIGIHFLPLARLFKVPRYYPLGGLFFAAGLLTLLAVPRTAHIGNALAWYVVPSLGSGLAAILTALASQREVRRFLPEIPNDAFILTN
jgi:hypothetical protein